MKTTDRQNAFLEAIRTACRESNVGHFDFSVEHWGVLWEPWFVYVNNISISLNIEHIEHSDLESLVANKLLVKTREYSDKDLNDPLEISRSQYQLPQRHS